MRFNLMLCWLTPSIAIDPEFGHLLDPSHTLAH